MQARIDSLGGHGRSGNADAAEALDQRSASGSLMAMLLPTTAFGMPQSPV